MPPKGAPEIPGRGRGVLSTRGAPPPLATSTSVVRQTLAPASQVRAICAKRPGYGTSGRVVEIFTNHFATELNHDTIYHYNVILPERPLPMARNFEVLNRLQTEVEPELFESPGAYDGRKNLFMAFELPFETGSREFSVPMGTPPLPDEVQPDGREPLEYCVRLTYVASINLEALQGFLHGERSPDKMVLTTITALNVVIRMAPNLGSPFNLRFFFTDSGAEDIGGGIGLWRKYLPSLRPAIGRMLIAFDISTGYMYMAGPLIGLALAHLNLPPNRPDALAPRRGLPERERVRLQRFITGLKITTSFGQREPGRQGPRSRVVKKLSKEGASDLTFELDNGQQTTVADYFQGVLGKTLRHPEVICVELSTGALIPLELCQVPPGQIMRNQAPPGDMISVLAAKSPLDRLASICNGLSVLDYEYLRQFGMTVADEPLRIQARVINAPTLKYHQSSQQSSVKPGNGAWNLINKRMLQPSQIPTWMVIIYEQQQLFNEQAATQVANDLVRACDVVGININPQPALIRWRSGEGNIGQQLRLASSECQRRTTSMPVLIVVILPEDANDIYAAVKHFGDVAMGVVTQCMKASKSFRAKAQYYANITLKLNVKLGGINAIPEADGVSFLTDSANPTIVMGAGVSHPAPGSRRPSFTSLVGSIDSSGVRYVSTMEVQTSRKETIESIGSMCTYVLKQYRGATGKYPKRILLYRSGVSEGQFATVLEEELPLIRNACVKLGFKPAITLIIVGRRHHVHFFPRIEDEGDRSGNCVAGTVVDSDVVNPVEFDFYLFSQGGSTGRPTHYNVLIDENKFTVDSLQSLTFTLCHVYARTTHTVSVPAPVYYAHLVRGRAKHHYDPQWGLDLFASETATDPAEALTTLEIFRQAFRPTHERMKKLMYFC